MSRMVTNDGPSSDVKTPASDLCTLRLRVNPYARVAPAREYGRTTQRIPTPIRLPSTNSCGTEMASAPRRSLISFCTSLLMNTSLSTNLTRWVRRICLTCRHRWYVSRTMPMVVVYSTTLPASFSCHVWNATELNEN